MLGLNSIWREYLSMMGVFLVAIGLSGELRANTMTNLTLYSTPTSTPTPPRHYDV